MESKACRRCQDPRETQSAQRATEADFAVGARTANSPAAPLCFANHQQLRSHAVPTDLCGVGQAFTPTVKACLPSQWGKHLGAFSSFCDSAFLSFVYCWRWSAHGKIRCGNDFIAWRRSMSAIRVRRKL